MTAPGHEPIIRHPAYPNRNLHQSTHPIKRISFHATAQHIQWSRHSLALHWSSITHQTLPYFIGNYAKTIATSLLPHSLFSYPACPAHIVLPKLSLHPFLLHVSISINHSILTPIFFKNYIYDSVTTFKKMTSGSFKSWHAKSPHKGLLWNKPHSDYLNLAKETPGEKL